ncbi:MAG: hypothetical protein K9L98_02180 [Candidatus Pacebacteria bacterium]|nr:hypothetical protein [Candidatus Paceibacterota bacterium]MCF7862794.1 hypothetical protein [Candidatus Paceibacterota bacterium]
MDNKIIEDKSLLKIVPLPVKILAVINYIIAVGVWISGIWAIFAGNILSRVMGQFFPPITTIGTAVFVVIGFIVILIGFVYFFVARGLWSGKNWTRILVIIISILGILVSIGSILNGNYDNFIILVINLIIGYYFIFNKSVKEAFIKINS